MATADRIRLWVDGEDGWKKAFTKTLIEKLIVLMVRFYWLVRSYCSVAFECGSGYFV